jgi:hypothetical protein
MMLVSNLNSELLSNFRPPRSLPRGVVLRFLVQARRTSSAAERFAIQQANGMLCRIRFQFMCVCVDALK